MKVLKSLILCFSLLFSATGAWAADSVNVNEADAQTLSRVLAGVGQAKAEAIVAYRDQHGPFNSVHELTRVSGIGPRTVEQNLDRIRLENPARQE
ncbi:competence protein ComEA [Ectothiorhodospira shaposhnikovii]|uniref:ComEA family DNA-binding protein n=1 Tax=Ectothiorhodospira shaposhnikovii TaxID=1054 RepID=UPI0019088737|nr:ComEA family DNA-binding protein [Ectothiorhodospira shaposhnikovii]MBK1673611.1 competence protein ComEA [Ectothiorhodospira shaposhnikovii]